MYVPRFCISPIMDSDAASWVCMSLLSLHLKLTPPHTHTLENIYKQTKLHSAYKDLEYSFKCHFSTKTLVRILSLEYTDRKH